MTSCKVGQLIGFTFICVSIMFVVVGRIETWDLTEGQALLEGWPFWWGGFVFGL